MLGSLRPLALRPLAVVRARALHATRAPQKAKQVGHVLELDAVTKWQETPVGGMNGTANHKDALWRIWYNPAIIPLYATIGLAAAVCAGFMAKYFGGHTEISFSKSIRSTFDHQGLSESRVASHNSHFGARSLNKGNVTLFPFSFKPMSAIAANHHVPYPTEE